MVISTVPAPWDRAHVRPHNRYRGKRNSTRKRSVHRVVLVCSVEQSDIDRDTVDPVAEFLQDEVA